MDLVISGKHSIKQLEEWAVEKFGDVVDKGVEVPDYKKPVLPYTEANLGQIVKFQPIKDKDTLEISFILPYVEDQYKSNPLKYFAHLLGHEGENSLLSYLKKEDYALDIYAGGYSHTVSYSDMGVVITLTQKGLENYQKVIAAVFKYTQRLVEVGPQPWVFEELRSVGQMQFDFIEKDDPLDYASELAE